MSKLLTVILFLLLHACLNAQSHNETKRHDKTKEINELVSTKEPKQIPSQRHVDEKEWKKIKQDKRFKYKRQIEEEENIERVQKPDPIDFSRYLNAGAFKWFLYIFFGLMLAYVIYLFFKNNNISFKKNIQDKKITLENPWEDVRNFEDWENALEKALNTKDYGLATRIYYLQTLQLLSQQNLIDFQNSNTNWQYINQLAGKLFQNEFIVLTQHFDYVWYGEYQLVEAQFMQLKNLFIEFHKDIRQ